MIKAGTWDLGLGCMRDCVRVEKVPHLISFEMKINLVLALCATVTAAAAAAPVAVTKIE